MKKLLLAAAVSVAAGSASAATVYDANGLTYDVNGDFQVQLRQDVGIDREPNVDFDDLEIKNYVSYALANDLTAFGRVDFDFKGDANGGSADEPVEEAYVGMQYGVASLSIGQQNFAGDSFGVEQAYELATVPEDRFDDMGTSGDDTVSLGIDLEQFALIATYEMDAEGENSENDEYFDLFASTNLGDLTLAAAYQKRDPIDGSDSLDTYGASAAYDFGFMSLAADYSTTDDVADQYNLAAVFAVAQTTSVAVGVADSDWEDDFITTQGTAGDYYVDTTEWYANVTYKFPAHTNVSVFAEVAGSDYEDESGEDADLGLLAGMRVKF